MAQERVVHTRAKKTDDIEIHVSSLDTEYGLFTDIREFIVSLNQYGRGLTFPARSDLLDTVLNGLEDATTREAVTT